MTAQPGSAPTLSTARPASAGRASGTAATAASGAVPLSSRLPPQLARIVETPLLDLSQLLWDETGEEVR